MVTYGIVYTAHAGIGGAAPFAFQASGAVNVFPGGSLETTVAIGCGTAIDTALIVVGVLMKPIDVIGAAETVFC